MTEGATTATSTFGVARVHASFAPTIGDPTTLRVRFSVTGFALTQAAPGCLPPRSQPDGIAVRTLFLGRASGPCGTIASTPKRRLLPVNPRHGVWRLQFDTSRVFHRARPSMLFVTLSATVSGLATNPPPPGLG